MLRMLQDDEHLTSFLSVLPAIQMLLQPIAAPPDRLTMLHPSPLGKTHSGGAKDNPTLEIKNSRPSRPCCMHSPDSHHEDNVSAFKHEKKQSALNLLASLPPQSHICQWVKHSSIARVPTLLLGFRKSLLMNGSMRLAKGLTFSHNKGATLCFHFSSRKVWALAFKT